ncbi:MAG: choice-of-anchor D domain-containing protein [Gemmatimonadetes bacterium]|nr:MAG: choice-of-anchor D domain-containing protein [Gemmatimonadota bacterium]
MYLGGFMRYFFVFVAALALMLGPAWAADFILTTADEPVVEDFATFEGAGFAPEPGTGQLDSDSWIATGLSDGDMMYGGTYDSGDYAKGMSDGSVTSGGIYAFHTGGGNYGLGVQPTGSDWSPGTFDLRILNSTGETLTSLDVSYNLWVNNDADRGNSFDLYYSTDGETFLETGLTYISPEAADGNGWVSNPFSTTLAGLTVDDGSYIYLRWHSDDMVGGGSRDEFALDDVSVTGMSGQISGAVIEADPANLDFGSVDVGMSATLSTVISNTGNQTLTINSVEIDNPAFTTEVSAPFTIAPGGSESISVTYTANDAGEASGTLTLDNTSINNPMLGVDLVGFGVPTVVTPIGDIQADPASYDGQVVRIEGVVTAGSGLLHGSRTNVFVQDDSGSGIMLFDFNLIYQTELVRGNEVRVVGEVTEYGGGCPTTEITNFTVEVLSSGNPEPAPIVLSTGDAGGADPALYEGTLIQSAGMINDVFYVGGGTNITINDGSGDAVFRVWDNTGIDLENVEVGMMATLTGVASCFNDAPQYLPAYQDQIEMEAVTDPLITVDPMSIDFGPVDVGGSADAIVTISNTGGATLSIAGLSTDNEVFTVDVSAPIDIEPGMSTNVTVTFSPDMADNFTGMLTITSNAVNSPVVEVALSGQGVNVGDVPALVINEIMQNPSMVSDGQGEWFELYNAGAEAVNLEGWIVRDNDDDYFEISGLLSIEPDGYLVLGINADFNTNGGVNVDYEYPVEFGLSNSADEIVLLMPDLTEVDRVEYDGGPEFPDPNGASMSLISPALDNNVGENWAEATTPWGEGTDLGTPGAPNDVGGEGVIITVDPADLDFGTVFVGETASATLMITNMGTATLTISEVVIDEPVFSTTVITPLEINPGSTFNMTVRFSPDAEGEFSGSLTLISNADNAPELVVPLMGVGQAALEPVPISEIQMDPASFEGQTVMIEGVVTDGAGVTNDFRLNAFIQDDSGYGIMLYNSSLIYETELVRGNEVRVTGTVTEFAGGCPTTEITDFTVEVLSSGNAEPAPLIRTTGEAGDPSVLAYEGTLIQSTGTITDVSGTGNVNITIDDGSGSTVFRVWESTGIDLSEVQVGRTATLRGIISCFSGNPQHLPAYQDHIEVEVSADPLIGVEPAAMDFGSVLVGESAVEMATISNSGGSTLTISDIASDNPAFTVDVSTPINIEPEESVTVDVTFSPDMAGEFSGILSITSNAGNFPVLEVALSGIGYEPVEIRDVVFTEIMYNPSSEQGSDEFYEYAELYNNDTEPADLSGFEYKDNVDDHIFVLPAGTILQPGEYLVLAANADSIRAYYGIDNVIGDVGIALNNGGDAVRLFAPDGQLVDAVTFTDDPPWPVEADGQGPALELIDPNLDNSLPENWTVCAFGGTPGMENCGNLETYSISGMVTYALGDNPPVPEVIVSSGEYMGNSDADGMYMITGVPAGEYTFIAERTPSVDPAQGISAFDAARVAQYSVGSYDFDEYQLIAADVTGDGSISPFDAARIAQYAIRLPQSSRAGEWAFLPESYTYAPLEMDMVDQDFTAILYGEVTGNWSPSAAARASKHQNVEIRNQEAGVRVVGNQIQRVDEVDAVIAFQFVLRTETDPQLAQNVPADWTLIHHRFEDGTVSVAAFGVTPLSGTELLDVSAETEILAGQINEHPAKVLATIHVPEQVTLHQNVPNPFNPKTAIRYELPQSMAVHLQVYDVAGRLVQTLLDGATQAAGQYTVEWNGTDLSGQPVSSGLYFYRLETGEFTDMKSMILLR